MKKLLFTTLAMASTALMAQKYEAFAKQRTYLYSHNVEGANYDVVGLRVDSVENLGSGDKVYHFNKTATKTSTTSYQLNTATWIGAKVLDKNQDNADVFYNSENDAITIYRDRNAGSKWVAYSSLLTTVEATVLSNTYENTIDGFDSVKTIGFKVYTPLMILLDYELNDKQIKIGKKTGLLQAINFREFPGKLSGSNTLHTYNLVGFTAPNTGAALLQWNDIYDFAVGDEFHTIEDKLSILSTFNAYDTTKVIAKITAVSSSNDSVFYTIAEQSVTIQNHHLTPIEISAQTRTYILAYPKVDDILPGNYYVKNGKLLYYTQRFENGQFRRVESLVGLGVLANSGSVFNIISTPFSCDFNINHFYVEGLGGPYFDLPSCGDAWESWTKKLVYYRKGSVESGTALDLDIITATNDQLLESQVALYPNPCQNELFVANTSSDLLTLVITDSYGNVVNRIEQLAASKSSVNTSNLNNGLYFYTITAKGGQKVYGKFVKQ